jgi:hypothetical protein
MSVWHRHSCLCQRVHLKKAGTDKSVCATHPWNRPFLLGL